MSVMDGTHQWQWRRFWRLWVATTVAGCALLFAVSGTATGISFLMGAGIGAISLLLIRQTVRILSRSVLTSESIASSRGGRAFRALILGGRIILLALMLKFALKWNGLSLPAFAVGLGYTQAVLVVYSLAGGFPENSPAD
ncbi:MAG: hypothetical protein ACUVSM_00210 [Armatimonadota bacterium]